MRSAAMQSILTLLALSPLTAGQAATFTTIGTVPGYAAIGAIKGDILYGTSPYSGSGVLFTMTTSGAYTALHNFNSATDGANPNARLGLDAAGNLFGTAPGGGQYGSGTLWEYTAAGVMQTPHAFGNNGDGAAPMQGPTMSRHGTVFGATGEGAINGSGNIFSLGRTGVYDVLYEFMSGADGHCPFSGVATGPDGALYGTTVGVGFGGNPTGSVWKFQGGVLTTLYVFQDGNDGEWPNQAPVVDRAGNVYGTTYIQGGANFAGAIWKITASTGKFSILHQMNGATDGYGPNSPLLIDSRGTLYGTAVSGGPDNGGTVFSVTASGEFHVVHSFTYGADGAEPTGNLVRGSDDVIYGGTGYGTVYSIAP